MSKINKKYLNEVSLIPDELIEKYIFLLRNQRVMFDFHLASLYGIETKLLKRTVKRNIDRFPEDFMFELNKEEYNSLRCHFGTLKRGEHSKYLPMAFTEQGVAMLSSVLKSKSAVRVNIEIMRTFVNMRKMFLSQKDLEMKINEMEFRYDAKFKIVFDALSELMKPPDSDYKELGFKVKEKKIKYK